MSFILKNGDLLLDSVRTTGDISLEATVGSILDNNGDLPEDNIEAVTATLVAAYGIGEETNPLEIDVDTLAAHATSSVADSGIYLDEENEIDLNDVTTVNGDIVIKATGPIIETFVSAGGDGVEVITDLSAIEPENTELENDVDQAIQSTFVSQILEIIEDAGGDGC